MNTTRIITSIVIFSLLLLLLCGCGSSTDSLTDISPDNTENSDFEVEDNAAAAINGIASPFPYTPWMVTMDNAFDLDGWFQFLIGPESPNWYVWEYDGNSVIKCSTYGPHGNLIAYYTYEYGVNDRYPLHSKQYLYSETAQDYLMYWTRDYSYVFTPDEQVIELNIEETAYYYDDDLNQKVNENIHKSYRYQYSYDDTGNLIYYRSDFANSNESYVQYLEYDIIYENGKMVRREQLYPENTANAEYIFEYSGEQLCTVTFRNSYLDTKLYINNLGLLEKMDSSLNSSCEYFYDDNGCLISMNSYYRGELDSATDCTVR